VEHDGLATASSHSRWDALYKSRLAQFRESFCVKVRPNPESANLYQFIEHRFGQINQPSPFRPGHDAEETRDREACISCSPPGAPFIDKEEISSTLDCKYDCFSFGVEIRAKLLHPLLVACRRDDQPRL